MGLDRDQALTSSATALAKMIRDGQVSSRELVELHISQIERVNPTLNAVVAKRYEEARAEADRADELRARVSKGKLAPFHGVPCTIKECFGLQGMPHSSGAVNRRGLIAYDDATAVSRLREAGAIPLGVTNTSELCLWMESNNYVYGRTNNPYDPSRTVGGSSGGEGAIVGAGASPFGLGSDIGGSIRMPAFFNGVFGHKPTGGLVPGTGQYPMAENEALRCLTTGPLCRKAEDLMPLLKILAGPDGKDEGCLEMTLGVPGAVDVRGLRILNLTKIDGLPVHPSLAHRQELLVDWFRRQGFRVEDVEFPRLKHSFEMWAAMMGEASEEPFKVMMGQGKAVSPIQELFKWAVGQSNHTAMASLLGLSEGIVDLLPNMAERLMREAAELREEMANRLGDDAILLMPSYTEPAPRHTVPFIKQHALRFNYAYTAVLNVLELPATQVPLGMDRLRLPLGIQVVGRHGNDHLTIAMAEHLEGVFGGWEPPELAGLG